MDRELNFLGEDGAISGLEVEFERFAWLPACLPPPPTTRLARRRDLLVARELNGEHSGKSPRQSAKERPASFGNQLAAKSLYFRPNLSMLSPAQHFIQFLQ